MEINKKMKAWRACAVSIMLLGMPTLQACEGSRRADQIIYICFNSSGGLDRAVGMIRNVSGDFGYVLERCGHQAKRDLELINANELVIPSGDPVQLMVENKNREILLIASNFGGVGNGLRMSFFYHQSNSEGPTFQSAVITRLESIDGANINYPDTETDISCG